MNIRWAALAAILLVAAGCASTSKVMLGRARAPIDPALVQIYSTPPAGSQEIAQLESASAVGFGTQGQTDAAVARLKREAAALGANGVLIGRPWVNALAARGQAGGDELGLMRVALYEQHFEAV